MNDEKKVGFVCPFCGGKVFADASGEEGVLLHSMPPCAKYLALEVADFMTQARIAMQRDIARRPKA